MKKINLEPNDENLIRTLENDILSRNGELVKFLGIIDNLDGNFFVSLDGEWGSGKTFFIRHLELILNCLRKQVMGSELDENDRKVEAIINTNSFENMGMENTFYPIYYNAWLYDNHKDPIFSIMYAIYMMTKLNLKESKSIMEKFLSAMKSFEFWNVNPGNLIESFRNPSMLDSIKSLEETKNSIMSIFDEIITERSQKLVIFIDELDRCRPSYAVELLERIKHFFTDDRIIFVTATNKSQLIHTIGNYYGQNFDTTGYLNKFFDLNIKIGNTDIVQYAKSLNSLVESSLYLNNVTFQLLNYMEFSLRDTATYIQRMETASRKLPKYDTDCGLLISIFAPIIIAYRMKDIDISIKIETGKGEKIIQEMIYNVESLRKIIVYHYTSANDEKELEKAISKFCEIYRIIFSDLHDELIVILNDRYSNKNLKKILMDICNLPNNE